MKSMMGYSLFWLVELMLYFLGETSELVNLVLEGLQALGSGGSGYGQGNSSNEAQTMRNLSPRRYVALWTWA